MRITYVVFILFLITPVFAQSTDFSITSDTNIQVSTSTIKSMDLTLTSSSEDTFLVRIIEEKPWVSLSTNRMTLEAGESASFSVYFSPEAGVMLGTYKITVIVESLTTGLQTEKALFVRIVKGEVVEIEKIVVRGDLIPTGSIDIEVHVKNFKTATASDVPVQTSVFSTHEIAAFSDIIERIDPDQVYVIKHRVTLERYSPPGAYSATAKLNYSGQYFETKQEFSVVERAIPRTTEETRYALFGYTKTINLKNYGNTLLQEYTITQNIDQLEQTFFYGDKPYSKTKDSYTWKFQNIAPGDQFSITYTISYVPVFAFIILIGVVVWFIFFKVRTLRIKKYIMQRKTIKEGTEFTVGIELRNTMGSKVTDVTVTDFVPSIFTVKDAHGVTAHRLKSGIGTELRWEIKELVKNDERVLSYKLVPVFGIHGQIKLPSAKVVFRSGKRKKTNSSFAPHLGIKQKKEE